MCFEIEIYRSHRKRKVTLFVHISHQDRDSMHTDGESTQKRLNHINNELANLMKSICAILFK